MKVLIFVAVACLLSGANAAGFVDTLKTLGNGITSIFTDLVDNLKEPVTNVANQLVDNLKTAGTGLLAQGAQSLLGSLSHLGETPTQSTRDLSVLSGVMKFVDEGKQIVAKLSETLGGLYHGAMNRLSQIAQTITSMDFLKQPLDKILGEISEVVDVHSILQNGIVKTLTTKPGQFLIKAAEGLISQALHKRSDLTAMLSAVGQQFASLFKPVVDAVNQHVQAFGSQLSQAATSIVGAVQPSLTQLGQQLNGHVQALKDSATELIGNGQGVLKALAQL